MHKEPNVTRLLLLRYIHRINKVYKKKYDILRRRVLQSILYILRFGKLESWNCQESGKYDDETYTQAEV